MTIKDISELAGVSIGTVDRVLHDRGRVSEATKEKVLRIVKESGYEANPFASHLSTSSKGYKFAVVIPFFEQDSKYWALVKQGVEKAAKELAKYKLNIEYFCFDRYSGEDFEKVYCEAVAGGFDGYLITPVISERAKTCLKNMPPPAPYAFFDTDLSTAAPVFTISQNSMRGGALAGKIMHLLIGDSGSVAVTRMSPEGEHIFERIAGFKRYFSVFPDIKVYEYHVEYAKEKKAVARVCNEILSNVPQIKGVFVPTANIHLFAERVRETGRGGDIKFVGFDLVPANINGLHSGDIDFIISQSPELQGEKSVEMLFNVIAFGESVPANHTVQLGIYTKENI